MSNPDEPPIAELRASTNPAAKLTGFQQAWVALPIAVAAIVPMVATLGAITFGLDAGFGYGAWQLNREVFRVTNRPVARYVWTGMITVGAFALFFALRLALVWAVRGIG